MILHIEELKKSVASEINRAENQKPAEFELSYSLGWEDEKREMKAVSQYEESLRQIIDAYDSAKTRAGGDPDYQSFQDWWDRGESEDAISGGNTNCCYGSYYEQMERHIVLPPGAEGYSFLQDNYLAETKNAIAKARAALGKKRCQNKLTARIERRTAQKRQDKYLQTIVEEMQSLGVRDFCLSKVPCCGLEQAINISQGIIPASSCSWIYTSYFSSFDELKAAMD